MRGLLRDKNLRGNKEPELEPGDLWVFEWKKNRGTIGSVIATNEDEAKRKLWRDLKELGHYGDMERLREKPPTWKVSRIPLDPMRRRNEKARVAAEGRFVERKRK